MNATGNRVRVGILGAGNSGLHYHAINNLLVSDGFDLRVMATGTEESAARASEVAGVEAVVGWESALSRKDLDLVVVALPHHLHAEAAIAAAEAGMHILVDKPMAVTVNECDRMIDAARQGGVLLEVFQQRRWEEDFQLLVRLLREKAIGEVWRFEVSRFHRQRYRSATPDHPHVGDRVLEWAHAAATGGGISYVVGPHPVDQMLTVMGDPSTVRGRVRQEEGEDVDSWLGIEMDFANGATGSVDVWREARDTPPRFVAHGTRGTLVARDGRSLELFGSDGRVQEFAGLEPPGRLGEHVYANLLGAIRGESDLAVGGDAGRRVVAVIEQALRGGREVVGDKAAR